MPRFVQPFRPNTDIGNSVQNLMTALFYKGGGDERPASQVALDRAQAEKVMAEAALARQTYGGRAGLGDALDAAMTRYSGARTRPMSLDYAQGPEAGLDLDPETLTRMIRNEPEVYAMGQRPAPALNIATRTYDAPDFADDMSDFGLPPVQPRQQGLRIRDEVPQFPGVRQIYGAPSISSPEDELRLAMQIAAAANLASTSSNPDQIAQAIGRLQTQGQERRFLEGGIDPTTWFQLDRKPVRAVQGGYDVDVTGERAPSPLGTALAAMEKDYASASGKGGSWKQGINPRTGKVEYAFMVPGQAPQWSGVNAKQTEGMSISFDENGNPVVQMGGVGPLTKQNQNKVQGASIDNAMTLDIIKLAEDVGKDPRNFGASGFLRETVQDGIQQGDALAKTLGGSALTVQKEIVGMGSDVGLENFDPNIPKLDMLINVLAFRMAKLNDPGGRVTDQDFRIAKRQVGGSGILANQKEFMSRLNLFKQMLGNQQTINSELLGTGRPVKSQPPRKAIESLPPGAELVPE